MYEEKYDIIVVGAGHAGCEAALACARMGANTLISSINLFSVAQMSCNPAIGGLAKGHLVKEIDALGGEMAVIADRTGIQFRMLNKSKGPSVWSPRSQNDRIDYSLQMKKILESQENLHLRQHDIRKLIIRKSKVFGVITDIGTKIFSDSVILCSGTFLNGVMHIGFKKLKGGRAGEIASKGISEQLKREGFDVGRLKTGTPPRLHGKNIDFNKTIIQPGDETPVPFSHQTDKINIQQLPCYLTKTNLKTHKVLESGLDRSPLYQGRIFGIGPRYCPSIEDKIVRFSDKPSHQIFLEPEGRDTLEYYVNGFATSLPEDIQVRAIQTIQGLENAKITRLGYAIEYDYFPPTQLYRTLETKKVENLYFAGQINGTSGYEEAAAQGLVAGINAVLKLKKEPAFTLKRDEAYIGVLIDDLITKDLSEPYRMFTSRAEYRLLLRQDNADLRLLGKGYKIGLKSHQQFKKLSDRKKHIQYWLDKTKAVFVKPKDINYTLEKIGSSKINNKVSLEQLLKRPEVRLTHFSDIFSKEFFTSMNSFWVKVREQVEIEIKYSGFLERQKAQVDKMKEMEKIKIPDQMDYDEINSLSTEGREKLKKIRPATFGQACRILGVSQSDLGLLMMVLSGRSSKYVSRETK